MTNRSSCKACCRIQYFPCEITELALFYDEVDSSALTWDDILDGRCEPIVSSLYVFWELLILGRWPSEVCMNCVCVS